MSNSSLIDIKSADNFITALKTPRKDKNGQNVSELIKDNKVNIVQNNSLNQFLTAYTSIYLNVCIDKTKLKSKLEQYLNVKLNGQVANIEKIKEIYNLCKTPLDPIVKADKKKAGPVISAAPIAGLVSFVPEPSSSKSAGEIALAQYKMNYDTLINTDNKYTKYLQKYDGLTQNVNNMVLPDAAFFGSRLHTAVYYQERKSLLKEALIAALDYNNPIFVDPNSQQKQVVIPIVGKYIATDQKSIDENTLGITTKQQLENEIKKQAEKEKKWIDLASKSSGNVLASHNFPSTLNVKIAENIGSVVKELLDKKAQDEDIVKNQAILAAAELAAAEKLKRETEAALLAAKEKEEAAQKAEEEEAERLRLAQVEAARLQTEAESARAAEEAARKRQATEEEQNRLAEVARHAELARQETKRKAQEEKAALLKKQEEARIAEAALLKAQEDTRLAEQQQEEAKRKEEEALKQQQELKTKKYKANVTFGLAVVDSTLYASNPEIKIDDLQEIPEYIKAGKITSENIDDVLKNQIKTTIKLDELLTANGSNNKEWLSLINTSFTTPGQGELSINKPILDVLKINYELYLDSQLDLYIKINSINHTGEKFEGYPISAADYSQYVYKYIDNSQFNFLNNANQAYFGNAVVGGKSRKKGKKYKNKRQNTKKTTKPTKTTKKYKNNKNKRKTRR